MSNTFGKMFKITSYGESHGGGVGVVVDGCPPGYKIDLKTVQKALDRRRPGTSALSSPREELDQVACFSGLENGVSLGTPIMLLVKNRDAKKADYSDLKEVFRPSHADLSTQLKYGIRATSGGGRASARETIARVAGGSIAEQVLTLLAPELRVLGFVESLGSCSSEPQDLTAITRESLESDPLRCPDKKAAKIMSSLILAAKEEGDSVGGVICVHAISPPAGLGEPVFDKLEADLARAMMSLPASKGFEVGSGFRAGKMMGSEHNDELRIDDLGRIRQLSNHSGGIQGGISNGETIVIRVAFKPVSSIRKIQKTVTKGHEEIDLQGVRGRHDPCVLPRAVPIVEAMMSLVLLDHFLRQLSTQEAKGPLAIQ